MTLFFDPGKTRMYPKRGDRLLMTTQELVKPTCEVDADGTKRWYLNDVLHREDGPAIEYVNGYKSWYLNGQRHRKGGPAIEYPNGDKEWWVNGKRHREDGPAVEYMNGEKDWYLNGKEVDPPKSE